MNLKSEVLTAVYEEFTYQDTKYGPQKEQSLPGWLVIIEREVQEAKEAWIKNHTEARQTCLEELVQVAACALRAVNQYGTSGSARSTNDDILSTLKCPHTRYWDNPVTLQRKCLDCGETWTI